jgi:hypothetical protein
MQAYQRELLFVCNSCKCKYSINAVHTQGRRPEPVATGWHTDRAPQPCNVFSALLFKTLFIYICPISYHINPNKNVIIHSVRQTAGIGEQKLQSHQLATKHARGGSDGGRQLVQAPLHCAGWVWIEYDWLSLNTQDVPLRSCVSRSCVLI